VLPMLTSNQVPDLYALWDIERRSAAPQPAVACASAIDPGSPPEAVSFLLELDEEGLASQEWRRIRRRRFPAPAEALAAARFEDDRGRPDLAIRVLWSSFQGLGSVSMADHPENVVRAYLPLRWAEPLKRAAREAGVDPWLLAGLARQESIFNRTARSPAGAIGVVQLLPSTARSHARALGLGRHPDLMDPAVNLEIGARELARLIRRFGAIEPALAAYNAGETRARRWWRRWPDRQRFTEAVPIPETYTYIRRVRFLGEAYRLVWADEWAGADVRTGRVAPGS